MKLLKKLALGTASPLPCSHRRPHAADTVKIGLVVKSLGNGFFEAANKGAQEAAKELGDVEVIYTGPTIDDRRRPDRGHQLADRAERQCHRHFGQRSGRPGSGAEEGDGARHHGDLLGFRRRQGRPHHAPQPVVERADRQDVPQARRRSSAGRQGDVAILSATSTATNQNTWIEEMKKQLPKFPKINLVTTVYGDDLADKSYREAKGLSDVVAESEGRSSRRPRSASLPPRRS